jgi:hypothetical protein
MKFWIAGFTAVFLAVFVPDSHAQTDLLPDLVTDEVLLSEYDFVNDIVPGWIHIRLDNAVANIGLGPMRVIPVAGNVGDVRQPILQRIGVDNNGDLVEDSTWDRLAGDFIYHPFHAHFHVEGWAQFQIREVLPADGVGKVLYAGKKTSFCLLDSARYTDQPSLGIVPNFPQFLSCADGIQGISVGWEDIYPKFLADQWINISGIVPGDYWLESVADPDNHILELDETNNVSRIKITITAGEIPAPIPVGIQTRFLVLLTCILLSVGAIQLRGLSLQRERD